MSGTCEPKVLLFVDNSNIFIAAKTEAYHREGRAAKDQVRLEFGKMVELALVGRPLAKAFVVGSIPPEEREVWNRLEDATGVKPELYERGGISGEEQGLDQCLQVHMLRAISDYADDPQIAVLMTGDGAGYDDGVGFHADMERMRAAGWGIEVISWKRSCRRVLSDWATTNGTLVCLDDYYESVTFLKGGGRRAAALDFSARQVSTPRPSPIRLAQLKAKEESDARIRELEAKVNLLEAKRAVKAAGKSKYDKRMRRRKK